MVWAWAAALVRADSPVLWVVPPSGHARQHAALPEGLGFIAQDARVPIIPAYRGDERKLGGLGPLFTPSGDVEPDIAEIKRFFAPLQGAEPITSCRMGAPR